MSQHNALFTAFDIGSGPVRVAVKDCIDIAGYPTAAGSAALSDAAPAVSHAAVVGALLSGGCRIVGKANMHELAFGVTGINPWTGSPRNPHFPDLVPGGSSSGSAVAVAEGLVDFAIGTDTGGSIRTPACCCGIVGLKPTFGRVSRAGARPRASTLDCIGPLARTVAGIEAAMTIIAPDYKPRSEEGIRIALVRPDGVDAPVLAAFDRAVAPLAGTTPSAQLPGLRDAYAANMAIIASETFAAFGHLLSSHRLGPDVEARLKAAALVDPDRLASARLVRHRFRLEVDAVLLDHDVIVMPTMPCFPLAVTDSGDTNAALRMTALVRPFNLTGHPALTVPAMAHEGKPIGIQIIGRRGDDETVCAFARVVERLVAADHVSSGEDLRS